ncbi:MAG: metallophosphoesterase [Bacteroidota bacterium]|jgi:predicted phosphodiesterase
MRQLLFLLFCASVIGIAQQEGERILFVSDTQQPLWIETFRLRDTGNEQATRLIYSAIANDSSAAMLFHLGDITAIGMFDAYWEPFDDFQSHLRIPVHPVLGNHDYFFIAGLALPQFQKRFHGFSTTTWYTTVINHVAVIALNSNESQLTDEEKMLQRRWYHEQLWNLNADSTVSAIIVVCHHSPFTNSTIVSPNKFVQHEFVTPFMMYDKCKIFISGHAHAYEHFRKNGKEFLVIGGGGGLLHPLMTGADERFQDLFSRTISPRFFHYSECTIQKDTIRFTVKALRPDFTGFETADVVSVPIAR